jgi:uncharacterized membrane protein YfcA
MKIPFFIGLIAALVHVLTGPDHLAAVTPLVLEKKSKYWKIGIGWGLGHVIGMLLIGLLFYFFKEQIPVEYISKNSEKFVGIMLFGIGVWAFYRATKYNRRLTYPHIHQDDGIDYMHIHKNEGKHKHSQTGKKHNVILSFLIGIVHGFAGISHFILMLPVLGYRSHIDAVLYMSGFAIGIVTAMVLYVSLLYKFSKNFTEKSQKKLVYFQYTGALFACLIGVYWFFVN